MVQRVAQLLNLVVELVLDLLSFFLLEEDLILIVDFGLSESLVALFADIGQPLLEAHLLGVVELLEVCELLLRVHINLVDLVLQLGLLLLKLILKFIDLLLKAFLGALDSSLVLLVLFFAKSQVLIFIILSGLEGLP